MLKKVVLAANLILCLPLLPVNARGDNGSEGIEESVAVGQVTGIVKDVHGEPIVGASVVEKGTHNAVVTDVDGKFSLKLGGKGNEIEVSYIGFTTQTIKATGKMVITLQEDQHSLQELVVVGYQSMRKTDVVGAVASVKAGELNTSTNSIGESLVGKVAGVQIAQVSGAPYKSTKIRVRGTASINASSDPLYVIDGYPSSGDLLLDPEDIASIEVLKDAASAAIYGSRAAGGVVIITTKRGQSGKAKVGYDFQLGVNSLAKKVKLLNSSQFADLVVDGRNNYYKRLLISKGIAWDDSYYGDTNAQRAQRLGSSNSAVNIPEFLYDFDKQEVITPQYDTDWQDELYRTAISQRHHITVNGGSDKVRYDLSGSFMDLAGIVRTSQQRRLNFRGNIDAKINDHLSVGANFSHVSNWNREIDEGRFDHGPILGALIYAPIFRCYDDNGNLVKGEMASYSSQYGFQQIENPVALAEETKIRRSGDRNTYNFNVAYEPLKDLTLKANLGMYTYYEKYEYYRPTSLSTGAYQPGSPQAQAAAYDISTSAHTNDYLGEFTANYNHSWAGVHNFSGVAGYSIQKHEYDILGVKGTGYEDDHIEEITGHGADPSDLSLYDTSKSNWAMLSYFTRLNYNYRSTYYLTASFRSDGSSLFGPKNRWGYFPSVSLAWTVSNEPFYNSLFGNKSTLKLRASWGKSGNNNIGNYNYEAVMSSPEGAVFGNGTVSSGVEPGGVKDNTIGWESTSQFNFGADLSLFNNRLSITANYYLSYTRDLLFEQPISAIGGANSILTNLPNSKIRNTGIDLQIDGRVIARDGMHLNVSGNFSVNRNKVLELDGGNTLIVNGAERSYKTHITEVGQPIGMFYGFKVAGMVRQSDMANIAEDDKHYDATTHKFQAGYKIKGPARSLSQSLPLQPGDIYFEDINDDGVVDDNDKTIIGNPHPKFTYGFNISGDYKSLDFSASFNGSYGNKVLDGQDYYLFNMEGSGNQYAVVDNRYRNESNPGNGWVYSASRGGTQSNSTRLSTFYLQSGSFFRCTNLTIGYSVPSIGKLTNNVFSKLRLYVAADNLFTITKYKGYNPEVDYNNGSNLTPGVDYGKYPLVRAFNFGVQLMF
ncbi:MAG TPA: SusC/RagA family protein [Prevotella sp.]|nr:SusC/RagA family protein [Prevotella sp.]